MGTKTDLVPVGTGTGFDSGFRAEQPMRSAVRRPRWQRRYARAAVVADITALVVAAASYRLWGTAAPEIALIIGVPVIALAVASLAVCRAWDPSVIGQDAAEFSRLLRGLLGAAVIVGLVSLALELPAGRPWVFGVLPLAGLLATAGRLVMRAGLHRRRRQGRARMRVLAIGTDESVVELIQRTRRAPRRGWSVAGVCTPTGTGPAGAGTVEGVPVLGDLDSAPRLARTGQFDAVSVAQTPGWSPRRLQQLAWDLEGTRTELIVDPGLMEMAGPRLRTTTVDGLPLLRLTHPTFVGAPQLLKGALDRVGALLLLLFLAPFLLVVAIAVRLDGGPAFYLQRRVGLGGREFNMIKFRTMVVDADRMLPALAAASEGAGPMFKMRRDPRVTRIGTALRRYSLDELPQLVNVLIGSMSLVGPRPPLPREVTRYGRDARRRLLVKPGMTGLWQVSGRSDLPWDESIRLDLRYVENWTIALDAQILVRTVRAVIGGHGAY